MKVLYVRVSDTVHAYIATMAARTGVSMAAITGLVLDEARRRGWQIETTASWVADTVDGPAASPRSPAAGSGPGSPDPHLPREPGPPGGPR